jgi:GntR family transcriptional regulator/MocR family aminotransferase
MLLSLQLDGQGALQRQLYRAVREAILAGQLRGGLRLPGTRAMAQQQCMARNTVIAAYAQLEAEGYLQVRGGSGYVVQALPQKQSVDLRGSPVASRAIATPFAERAAQLAQQRAQAGERVAPRLDLRYGLPLSIPGPLVAWRRALSWAVERASMDYPAAAGLPQLRHALAHWLGRRRGFVVDPERILVVSGAQQALDLCVRVLAGPGVRAMLEDPHYQGTRQALQCAAVPWQAVPVDASGLCAEQLPECVGALLFVTPAHQFPGGAVLTPARRMMILDWAQRQCAWVIEDDYDSEFRYDSQPVPALKSLDRADRVIHIGTLSKALFPALRLGFMVLPLVLRDAFLGAKWLSDRGNPAIEQLALARLIQSGRFEALLRLAKRQLDTRRRALIAALQQHCAGALQWRISGSEAGMHLCIWFDALPAAHTESVIAAAYAVGVGVYPISPYYAKPPAQLGLLLGYCGLPPAEITEATRRLCQVLDTYAKELSRPHRESG